MTIIISRLECQYVWLHKYGIKTMRLRLLLNFIHYILFSNALTNLPSKASSLLVNTINQYSYCMAQKDSYFKKSLQNSDVLLPDGIGAVAAARLLTGQKIKKI